MYAASKHAAGVLTESIRLALAGQPIRVTAIMPGAVATNLIRSMPPETLAGIAKMTGVDLESTGWKPGDRMPEGLLENGAKMLKNFVMAPEDIAEAVVFALSAPETVQINEIMIRPLQPLQLPGVSVPA